MIVTGNVSSSANRRTASSLGSLNPSAQPDRRRKYAFEFEPGEWNDRKYRANLVTNEQLRKSAKELVQKFLIEGYKLR